MLVRVRVDRSLGGACRGSRACACERQRLPAAFLRFTPYRPGVGVHNLAWRGTPHLSILWLRLPLASNGSDVDMILGYDALLGAQGESLTSGIRAA